MQWKIARALLSGAMLSIAAAPGFAQSDEGEFSTENPAYQHLAELEDIAVNLVLNGARDAEGQAAVRAAYSKLQQAAEQTLLADGSPHPLAHVARIKIASSLYASGELDAALEEVRSGIDGTRPYVTQYPQSFAEGIALMGVLLVQAGKAGEALPIVLQGLEDYDRYYETVPITDRKRSLTVAKSNLEFSLSQISARMGETENALAYQAASLKTREDSLGPNDPDTIASYYGYAGTLRAAGKFAEAETYARTAVERAAIHVDQSDPVYARSLEMLSIVLSRTGRPIEATDYLLTALRLKREHEGTDNLIFGYGLHNLATILHQRERYADALPFFIEAEALFRKKQGPGSPYAIGSLSYAAQIDFAEGHSGRATELFRQLEQRLGTDSRDIEILLRIEPDFIMALLDTGDVAEASAHAKLLLDRVLASYAADPFVINNVKLLKAYTDQWAGMAGSEPSLAAAWALIDTLRDDGVASGRGFLSIPQRAALDLVMDVAARENDAGLMVAAMGLMGASDILEASAQRRERLAAANPALADAIRKMQDANAAFEAADQAILLALGNGHDTAQPQRDYDKARAERDVALAALSADFPEWESSRPALDPTLDALQQSLDAGSAVLSVVPAYSGSYVLLVTPERNLAFRATLGRAQMLGLARRLGTSVRAGSFDQEASTALSAAIFTPQITTALADIQALRIFTSGSLSSLPFSLLQQPASSGDGWLIDRFALSNLSDLQPVPKNASVTGQQAGLRTFAAFAAPSSPQKSDGGEVAQGAAAQAINIFFTRSAADVSALANLPPLPSTLREASAIAALFGDEASTLLTGDAASEQSLKLDAVRQADVLLFATHGLVAGEIEGIAEPSLVLSPPAAATSGEDGLLTVSEIAKLTLSADWVLLSACDSAGGMQGGLPAFSGLAQAFRYAGANSLMVTHWKVRDDIAAYVSVEALRNYRAGMTKSAALRDAVRRLRKESGIDGAQEPFAWAPFALLE